MSEKAVTVELTESEMAVLRDAARGHEQATIRSGLRNDHPIFADLASVRRKLQTADKEFGGTA